MADDGISTALVCVIILSKKLLQMCLSWGSFHTKTGLIAPVRSWQHTGQIASDLEDNQRAEEIIESLTQPNYSWHRQTRWGPKVWHRMTEFCSWITKEMSPHAALRIGQGLCVYGMWGLIFRLTMWACLDICNESAFNPQLWWLTLIVVQSRWILLLHFINA